MAEPTNNRNLLEGARVYLSGPMDFVASRIYEKHCGWRNRVRDFLSACGVTVFNPWHKPSVKGRNAYAEEDAMAAEIRRCWTFAPDAEGARSRARCAVNFGEHVHIDLRMVDISDFVIAYCPTNIYSVGTPHEIIVATQQHKPVLFVSPPVEFSALEALEKRLEGDVELSALLERVKDEIPIRPNPAGIPSLWYMPIVGSENFFDGFGYAAYRERFGWTEEADLLRELNRPPQRPLFPFLERMTQGHYPQRWDPRENRFIDDSDWLLLEDALGQGQRSPAPDPARQGVGGK